MTDDARQRATALEAQGWAALEEARDLLAGLVQAEGATDTAADAGQVRPHLWRIERSLEARRGMLRHFSQHGQDAWLDRHVFRGRRDGVFVDIGGYDGVTGSNTLFFELFMGWTGLLFEPVPDYCDRAARIRRCPCHCVALGAEEGHADFLQVERGFTQMSGLMRGMTERQLRVIRGNRRNRESLRQVPVRRLAPYLRAARISRIDYLSLDVEGGEMEILRTFPFADVPVAAWTVENNEGIPDIGELMARNGYRMAARIGVDEVYLPA
ncbi:FkbM family methyltransferase [Marinibaculum pumilum]|uniref:FkbM family methyltransferase n=1 Tax=Marinibaculum pumilum TaxID=1766165 RepID=A0ABV7KWA9_9PROT